jgi:citronellol/citronellal dehydrogenase
MPYQSNFAAGLFAGQTHVVTGGGSGIGRALAHELSSLGASVLLLGRKIEKLEAVAAEIREDGGSAACYAFDIRDEDAVKASVKQMLIDHPRIHGLSNNAGGQFPSPLAFISKKGFEAVVSNNLTGGFLVARELYNQHFKKHGGSIVNMLADMWGGMPGMGHSGAAREGMKNLTETMAIEWSAAGVRVNAVAPGWVASSGLDTYDDSFKKTFIPQMRSAVPLSRLAEEAEIASAMTFLLSPAAAYITGITIKIDGGSSLNNKIFPLQKHQNSVPYQGFHRAQRPKVLELLKD